MHSFLLIYFNINPLNAELNPIGHLLALLGVPHILHIGRIRVKPLNVSSRLVAHHQEDQLCVNGNWYRHALW